MVRWYGGASGEPLTVNFFEFFGGHESARLEHFYDETSGPQPIATSRRWCSWSVPTGSTPRSVERSAGRRQHRRCATCATAGSVGKAVLRVA